MIRLKVNLLFCTSTDHLKNWQRTNHFSSQIKRLKMFVTSSKRILFKFLIIAAVLRFLVMVCQTSTKLSSTELKLAKLLWNKLNTTSLFESAWESKPQFPSWVLKFGCMTVCWNKFHVPTQLTWSEQNSSIYTVSGLSRLVLPS